MTAEFVRFVIVGGIGFLVDGGGTWLLTDLGLSPFLARVPALVVAMIVTWLLNRSVTFRVARPRSRSEMARYMKVAISSALINFLLYSAMVAIGIHPLIAIVIATCVLLLGSFFAYRHLVFR